MPGGRPTKYKSEYADQAFKYCLLGATDAELAEFFDVNEDTINEWKKKEPKFSESLKAGKVKADAEVTDKLRQRAEGYSWVEDVPIKLRRTFYDENGKKVEEERVEIVPVTKTVPPDPTSGIFWLKNRRSQNWREKQDVDLKSGGEPIGDLVAAAILRAYGKPSSGTGTP
jgi:hypothetical protein